MSTTDALVSAPPPPSLLSTVHAESVLVIIPAHNEERTVGTVVRDVTGLGLTCLVIDDASTDTTRLVALAAGADVIHLERRSGVGAALQTGFIAAVARGYRAVVQVDADGQHPVDSVPSLLDTAHRTGASLVVGTRFDHPAGYPMSPLRRNAIRLFAHLMEPRIGVRLADPTSGFRLICSPLLEHFATNFPTHYLGDTVEATLLAARRGITPVEVPVAMQPRRHGNPTAISRSLHGLALAYRSVLATPRRDLH